MSNRSEPTLVSVVVPVKNRREFVGPTIESILKQDYPAIECIVVDGASNDGTLDIVKSFGDRITWISEVDRSASDAINKGWTMCRGDIIAWLNADDVWEVPSAISAVVAIMNAHPEIDILYGDCGRIDAKGNRIGECSYMRGWNLEHAIEHCEHGIPQPAAFIRRRAIERVGMLDPSLIFMDRDLWYRIGLSGVIRYESMLLAHARDVPSYWLRRGREAADDCVNIIKRIVAQPELPESLKRKRQRVVSNAYLRAIDYAYHSDRFWMKIVSLLAHACIEDPSNAKRAFQRIRPYIREDAKNRPVWRAVDILMKPLWLWAWPGEKLW